MNERGCKERTRIRKLQRKRDVRKRRKKIRRERIIVKKKDKIKRMLKKEEENRG